MVGRLAWDDDVWLVVGSLTVFEVAVDVENDNVTSLVAVSTTVSLKVKGN